MLKINLGQIFMWGLVFLALICVIFNACDHFYAKLEIQHDNVVEEAVEDIIKEETGIEIDLTPSSKE